ncbi:unnamed protein product [Heligmosomoides polygyrus]|uniref:Uncharacterized protein n=1 Tax=Heligmosomoides polygyrus TaxID=6339 RepID=A0A183F6W8_HELPZ|nr:unnamed protein product [Heligmosomoides polygyrus]
MRRCRSDESADDAEERLPAAKDDREELGSANEGARRLRDEDFDELMAACDTAKNAVKKDKAISRATRNISDDEVDVSTDDVPPPVRTTRAARPRDEQPESPLQKAEEPQPISQIPPPVERAERARRAARSASPDERVDRSQRPARLTSPVEKAEKAPRALDKQVTNS